MKATEDSILNYLKEIKTKLKEKGIEKIALFGSYSKDEQTVYSDIYIFDLDSTSSFKKSIEKELIYI